MPYASSKEPQMLLDCLRNLPAYQEDQELRRQVRHVKTDEKRQQILDAFWADRDPTPATPQNEARIMYEQRCQEAQREFGRTDAGVLSDRGRVWVLLGEPDDRFTPFERSHMSPGGFDVAVSRERWVYYNLPDTTLGPHFEVEFVSRAHSPSYRLASRVSILDGPASSIATGALREIMDLSQAEQAATETPESEVTLDGLLLQEKPREGFPFSEHVMFLKSLKPEDAGITTLLLTVRVRPKDLASKVPLEKLALTAATRIRLEKPPEPPAPAEDDPFALAEPAPSAEDEKATGYEYAELLPYAKNSRLKTARYFQIALPFKPGSYRAFVGVMEESEKKKASVKKLSLEVPSLDPPYPQISTPVLVRGGVKTLGDEEVKALKAKGSFTPLIIGGKHVVVPRFDNVLSKKAEDALTVYCQVYNPRSEESRVNAPYDVELRREIKMKDQLVFQKLKPQKINKEPLVGNVYRFNMPADLLAQYPEGSYRFEIVIKDTSDPSETASATIEFELTE
ncbi:MAG: GWxTD domain-containing protein [Acidobacteriota bacterium]|nr:MAG: GWxTD domain-containing protein [Acidobacteriota bacterium]